MLSNKINNESQKSPYPSKRIPKTKWTVFFMPFYELKILCFQNYLQVTVSTRSIYMKISGKQETPSGTY